MRMVDNLRLYNVRIWSREYKTRATTPEKAITNAGVRYAREVGEAIGLVLYKLQYGKIDHEVNEVVGRVL